MIMSFFYLLLSKGYLLEQNREKDTPIPIFKTISQIVEENLFLIVTTFLLIFVLALLFIALRKKKKNEFTQEEAGPTDPYKEALEGIENLQSQKPPLSAKPFVFRLSEILRIYVEKVFKVPAMELTGEEFMKEIASHAFFMNRYDETLQEFIDQGDQIKYSKVKTDDGQMKLLLNTALHFVKDTHAKLQEEATITPAPNS
jgi:cbb3-type cytochrome oxidase subunit 3